jgi:hypothetical protein
MPPRVPLSPQVQEQIHPGVRLDASVPEGAFGGGRPLAHNVALANQNIDIIKEEQQKIDFYDALDGITQLKKWENESGYESVLGENARELPKRMQEEYSKRTADIAGTLKNDRQRAIFQQKADQNGVGFMGGVVNHTRRQKSISEAQKTDAFVSTFQDAGIKAGASGNFEEMDRQIGELDGVRRVWASQNGIPDAAVGEMLQKEKSHVYASAIGMMLDNKNDRGAKEAFTAYKGKLSAKDLARLGPMVQKESVLGDAYRLADAVMAFEPDTLKTGMDHLDKIAQNHELSPEVREKASHLLSQKYAIKLDALEQAHKKNMGEAKNLIDGGKTFDDLPATLRSTLNATAEKELRKYGSKEPVTDDPTWYALMQMSTRDPERFKNENLLNHLTKLSRSDFQEVSKVQMELQKGKRSKRADGFRSVEGIVSGTIKSSKLNADDHERFMRVVDSEIARWQEKHPDEDVDKKMVQDTTDLLLKEVVTDSFLFWKLRDPLYKAESEADVKASEKRGDAISKMSIEDRTRITNDMKADGVPLTEVNILRYHKAMLADRTRSKNAGK